MSRASSRHIRRLEDVIRAAQEELKKTRPHEPVLEPQNPNCQCGPCRAERVLSGAPLRTTP